MVTSLTGSNIVYNDATTQSTAFVDTGTLISINSYTTAGTYNWTNPGASTVVVKLAGGGGGGCGYCESGGAGGYAEGSVNVTGVSSVTVTVGGGGGATGYYSVSGTGGTTSFGSYLSATGGGGANNTNSHTGGSGGVGSGGQINLTGGGGSGHINSVSYFPGGKGGNTPFGGSVSWRRSDNAGITGSAAPGSGGVGTRSDGGGTGSNGADGAVIVYSYK
jgi:hypothetical protein